MDELPFEADGNLRTGVDPKHAWGEAHLLHTLGTGSHRAGAQRVCRATRLTELGQLYRLGIRTPDQTAPYILFAGHHPPAQLPLFDLH